MYDFLGPPQEPGRRTSARRRPGPYDYLGPPLGPEIRVDFGDVAMPPTFDFLPDVDGLFSRHASGLFEVPVPSFFSQAHDLEQGKPSLLRLPSHNQLLSGDVHGSISQPQQQGPEVHRSREAKISREERQPVQQGLDNAVSRAAFEEQVLVNVPGHLVRASDAPESASRRMSAEQEQQFFELLQKEETTAEDLRKLVSSFGFDGYTDNFDMLIELRKAKKPIADYIDYRLPDVPKQGDGAMGAAARGFADSWNFLDELGAAVDVLGGTPGRQNIWNSGRPLTDLYYDNLDYNRAILKADARDHPLARMGGQVVSNLVLPIGNKANTAAKLAKWGAVEGGLAGFGAGEGWGRVPGAALGTAVGGATGYVGGRAFELAGPMVDVTRSRLGFPRVGPHGPIYSHLSGNYHAARDRLLTEKTGEVPGVLAHPEIGPIDLIYGNEKYGLAHIQSSHPDVLDNLPKIVGDTPVRIPAHEHQKGRHILGDEIHEAVVPTDFDGRTKDWLLTAYRRERAPGDQTPGRDPLSPDGVSTGAEQVRSIDVRAGQGKTLSGPSRDTKPDLGSFEAPILITSKSELHVLKKGTWVEYRGKRFPKG